MRSLLLVVLVIAALIAGCARLPRYEANALAPPELHAAREQVRGYARTHLDAEAWSSTLSAAQPKVLALAKD